jgi:hypothetical protein
VSPIVNSTAVALVAVAIVAVVARHGTLLDGRVYVAAALWIVAILGNYGGGGYAWPGGPAIDEDTQALMVIVGLVAWLAAIVLTVRIAIRPEDPILRLIPQSLTDFARTNGQRGRFRPRGRSAHIGPLGAPSRSIGRSSPGLGGASAGRATADSIDDELDRTLRGDRPPP